MHGYGPRTSIYDEFLGLHVKGQPPAGVAETIDLAIEAGIAGASVEDWNPSSAAVYDHDLAVERVAAAADAAHADAQRLVLTARAENHIRGVPDLDDTIRRLQAYGAAGADVLYAPALTEAPSTRPEASSSTFWLTNGSAHAYVDTQPIS